MAIRKGELLDHFIILQEAVEAMAAEAILGLTNFFVFIRAPGRTLVLYPQFLVEVDGVRQYTLQFSARARRFIGWLPYYNKRWELASDKLLFKAWASSHGIATPAHAPARELAGAGLGDFIVKQRHSSFGRGIRGPFHSTALASLQLEEDEYAEQFVFGKSLKIWYWEDTPVCMEIDTMPTVTGDGQASIRALLERRLSDLKRGKGRRADAADTSSCDFSGVEQYLAYAGCTLDTVLPYGTSQTVDLRYGTPYMLPAFRKTLDLKRRMPQDLREQLLHIGRASWSGIPENVRAGTAYTVDAILASDRTIHVLEMNSNPFLHPLLYRHIIPAYLSEPLAMDEAQPHETNLH